VRCGVFVCDLCVNVTLYGGLRWTEQNNVCFLTSHISGVANRASDSRHDKASRLWRDFGVQVVLAYLPGSLVKSCQSQYKLKNHKMQVPEAK